MVQNQIKAGARAENGAQVQEGNQAGTEAKWGFLKNIVNIDSFFSSGGQQSSSKSHKKSGQAPGSLVQKKSHSVSAKKTNSD